MFSAAGRTIFFTPCPALVSTTMLTSPRSQACFESSTLLSKQMTRPVRGYDDGKPPLAITQLDLPMPIRPCGGITECLPEISKHAAS